MFLECLKLGIPIRGILHDFSKFRPSEFFPYAKHFYGEKGNIKKGRDKTGCYKPYDTGDFAFDYAWFLHQKRNSHHWQWWVMPLDSDGTVSQVVKLVPMKDKVVLEMVADWRGAGRAQGTPDVKAWYEKNKNKLVISCDTRLKVEKLLYGDSA